MQKIEVLSELVRRMAEAPKVAEALVKQRGEASDALHRALEAAKEIEVTVGGQVANERGRDGRPVYGNSAQRAAEEFARLSKNGNWKKLQEEIDQQRVALRMCDAQLESLRLQAKADEALIGLATGLINAGRLEEAESILDAYAGQGAEGQAGEVRNAPQAPAPENKGTETGVFTVLEARVSNPEKGTIRAFCEADDGSKYAVFGKNGVGTTLAGAVGRRVKIRYRQADKGLYAVAAEVA